MKLTPALTNEQLQKLRDESRRLGRALSLAETAWALREHKRIFFECEIADLTWDARLMSQVNEEVDSLREQAITLCGRASTATEAPAIWVVQRPDGKFCLQDGYHRVAAAMRMNKTTISAYREEI